MKIIAVDSYGRDTRSDILVCENVSEYNGTRIVNLLNEAEGDRGSLFYRLVPDEHVLHVWEP